MLVMGKGREETGIHRQPGSDHINLGGGRGPESQAFLAGGTRLSQQEEARGSGVDSVLPSLQVTMRGATQVSVILLLVTVSDGAVITGVSHLAVPCALGFGSKPGTTRGANQREGRVCHQTAVQKPFT